MKTTKPVNQIKLEPVTVNTPLFYYRDGNLRYKGIETTGLMNPKEKEVTIFFN